MRKFDTGAIRDSEGDKFDFEGCISPLVLKRFAQYMDEHCTQADGEVRSVDNWQKGLPKEVYMKSKVRHGMTTWLLWRGFPQHDERDGHDITLEESLCGELFNLQGLLFELLKENGNTEEEEETDVQET